MEEDDNSRARSCVPVSNQRKRARETGNKGSTSRQPGEISQQDEHNPEDDSGVHGVQMNEANQELNEDAGIVLVRARGRNRGQRHGRTQVSGEGELEYPWHLQSPAPGGPEIVDLLWGFGGHIARYLWDNPNYHEPLVCHTRVEALNSWSLRDVQPPSHGGSWVDIVESTGLAHLPDCMFRRVNASLITAFVERWQPETNTFHMPFGEMTITLHDVQEILGIPIDGDVVRYEGQLSDTGAASVVQPAFTDLVLLRALDNLNFKSGVPMSRIREACSIDGLPANSRARGYLLYLLGTTLFVDKSQSLVPSNYLPLLEDLTAVPRYAWGAATLSYLYYQLGVASRGKAMQISGCLTLLEAWIYEHFPMFSQVERPGWTPGMPRAKRWNNVAAATKDKERLITYRIMLDKMIPERVLWTPYGIPAEQIDRVCLYHGCIRFIHFNEAYMPERVTRQFGIVQGIPRDPMMPLLKNLSRFSKSYKKVYGDHDSSWNYRDSHCFNPSELGESAVFIPWAVTDNYLGWYQRRTHSVVQNPAHGGPNIDTANLHMTPEQENQALRGIIFPLQHMMKKSTEWDPDYLMSQIDRCAEILNRTNLASNASTNDEATPLKVSMRRNS